jgi:hypothetical protein
VRNQKKVMTRADHVAMAAHVVQGQMGNGGGCRQVEQGLIKTELGWGENKALTKRKKQ